MWKCPGCGSKELDVLVTVWARLSQEKSKTRLPGVDFYTDVTEGLDGSHEWDDQSQMLCRECGKQDRAGKFETEGKED